MICVSPIMAWRCWSATRHLFRLFRTVATFCSARMTQPRVDCDWNGFIDVTRYAARRAEGLRKLNGAFPRFDASDGPRQPLNQFGRIRLGQRRGDPIEIGIRQPGAPAAGCVRRPDVVVLAQPGGPQDQQLAIARRERRGAPLDVARERQPVAAELRVA